MPVEENNPLTTTGADTSTGKRLVIGIAIAVCMLTILLVTMTSGYRGNSPASQTTHQSIDVTNQATKTPASLSVVSAGEGKNTVQASVKDFEDSPYTHYTTDANSPPYTAESILAALQHVNLDNQGNLIVDHAAFLALKRTLGHRALKLDTLQLAELQALIEIGLPGEAGQQVAYIAGKFYNYLQAKKEYLDLHRDTDRVKDYRAKQQQLTKLRHIYLDEELTQQLFSRHDAENTYFYERFMLASNDELSISERQQQTEAINQRLMLGLATSLGLKDKYQHYLQQQDKLLNSENNIDAPQWDKLWRDTFTDAEQHALHSLSVQPYPLRNQ